MRRAAVSIHCRRTSTLQSPDYLTWQPVGLGQILSSLCQRVATIPKSERLPATGLAVTVLVSTMQGH